jgi:hypothetical protein
MSTILVLPGWMTTLKLYNEHESDLRILIGKLDEESFAADCVVGLSLGSLVVLKDSAKISGKIILINPPVPKRNIFKWFLNWVNYARTEGLFLERQKFTKNPVRFGLEIVMCTKLLSVDFSEAIDRAKGKLMVIRSKHDRFFCDDEAVRFLRAKNITIIEIDAGHNWCKAMEKAMNEQMTNSNSPTVTGDACAN